MDCSHQHLVSLQHLRNLLLGWISFDVLQKFMHLPGQFFITTLFTVCFFNPEPNPQLFAWNCTNYTLFARNPSKYCNDDIGDVTAHRWIFVANVNVTYYLHLYDLTIQLLMFGGHLFDFMREFREMLEYEYRLPDTKD
jgi:hypothetical protein